MAARHAGDAPDDRGDPSLLRHKLSFEVRAETMALFRDLQAKVRSDLGGDADDDALLFEIARRALGGPDDEGRASYQVAVVRCEDCDRASLDSTAGGAARPRALCRRWLPKPPLSRVHHLDPRAEGGGHDPERMALVCGAHHRNVHAGHLCIDGTASEGFVFRHPDGTPYGQARRPPSIDAAGQARRALQKMGFKATAARELVAVAIRNGAAPNDCAAILQAALKVS